LIVLHGMLDLIMKAKKIKGETMQQEKKYDQKDLANNWESYIKAALLVAYNSPTKYTIEPYKRLNGIKKVTVIKGTL